MNATLQRLNHSARQKQEEIELAQKPQWRQLVQDIVNQVVSRTDDDVLLELEQLGKSIADLNAAVAECHNRKLCIQARLDGKEAEKQLPQLEQDQNARNQEYNRQINELKRKMGEESDETRAKTLTAQQAVIKGNDATVWLMEHWDDDTLQKLQPLKHSLQNISRQRNELLGRRGAQLSEQARERSVKEETALAQRSKQIAAEIAAIEQAALSAL